MDEASIEEARRTLGLIVDKARLANTPTVITRQGKPAAVVVSTAWYEVTDHSTYTLAEIREGTGWPRGARFALVSEDA
jgi:prevent-host-death family protein